MKKRYLFIVVGMFAILGFFLGFYLFKSQDLAERLKTEQEINRLSSIENSFHANLYAIDSLLSQGKYGQARESYRTLLTSYDTLYHPLIDLRLALTQDILIMKANNSQKNDSSTVKEPATNSFQTPRNENDPIYDSLRFVLMKANVQIENLKKRLVNADNGDYLKFTNKKGYEVYYVGKVVSDKANGRGVALFSSGGRYEGEWNDNQRHGRGIYFWPDGAYYDGHYQQDKRSGLGSYYWPNGEKFIGQWQDDQRHGFGTFYDIEGQVKVKGLWDGDELIEQQ